ncbi:hypothetical protein JOQ06_019260 [Pogonophryne albipinna]|uniref:HECT domain-containing protein n=1 Tax=Pogonophryne albipinna TaxID=1090488 RepID=A0AAD6FCU0_9TELE|nr:hypothetical protein JOQ06_019260 [Pogonophryne albipinna]
MKSDIGAGKPRRRRMADDKEIELQNAARRVVDLLRSALAEPTSQNHEVQVQGEQVEVGNRQPTIQGQQQSALGNRQQAGTRQRQAVQGQQQQRTPGFPSTAGNTVDKNMARAFPGLFKSGKSYTPPPKRRALRSTPIQFFLLNKCTERTPNSSDEMVLLQAGLGRRTLNIPENADHSQISYILMESYSKMVPLDGAWMLHKAAGGSGQRKLSVLVPEAEGYTGAYLAKALGGKGCLYIMPIQDTLDTSPLPYSSKEFENMPKARCAMCHLSMPVQLLALHAQECEPSSCSDRMDLEPDLDPDLDESPATSNPGNVSSLIFLAEAIETLSGRVDTTTLFNVSVTREDIFERGLGQWRRQKRSSPKNPIRVSFIGESGIDHGALRKEFLTEMMAGVERKFFQGGSTGKTPKYSITDYHKEHFKTAGEIMAVSIVQGGPPPNFFREWCYGYISTGEMDRDSISKEDVTDPELSQLMEEVEIAEPEAMYDLLDRITACGYSGPATWERKEEIIKAIILHSSVRILPMLQQICSGMKLYGLCEMIVQQPHNFRDLFVPGLHQKPDAEFLMGAISPVFSELGSLRRQRESRIINFLQDFIQNIEDEEEEKSCVVEERGTPVKITESDLDDGDSRETESTGEPARDEEEMKEQYKITVGCFLQWLTGQAHVPITSTERERFKILIEFDHDCSVRYGTHTVCFPVVNACSNSITFPTRHLGSYPEFLSIITQAVMSSREFSLP